jgi:hypothetical protein
LFKFKIRRGGGGFLIKTIQAKIKIEFISNNFGFHKNMQSYRCMMMHDAQTIKEQSILKKGDFSGPLQSTPPTRDLTPRSTLV